MGTICAFSGCRTQPFWCAGDETLSECLRIKNHLAVEIFRMTEEGTDCFMTGMARGADLWAAEIVLALKKRNPFLRLICVLPFPQQAGRWSEEDRQRHRAVLEAADETVVISPRYDRNCTMRRVRYLVGKADLLLAVSDGRATGEAATAIRMARRARKEICLIETGRTALDAEPASKGGDTVFQMQQARSR